MAAPNVVLEEDMAEPIDPAKLADKSDALIREAKSLLQQAESKPKEEREQLEKIAESLLNEARDLTNLAKSSQR